MGESDFYQIVSEVPQVIGQVHKARSGHTPPDQSTCDVDLFFDFRGYYKDGQPLPSSPEARSRYDTSSIPSLTSGSTPTPSEEGGSPSPGPTEDQFRLREEVKVAKQHDDRHTFPERDIRPKGPMLYPPYLQLNSAPSTNAAHVSNGQSTPESNSLTPASSDNENHSNRRSSTHSQGPKRGVRIGSLDHDNRDKIAEVRAMGACHPCRMRKVSCDLKKVCGECSRRATKNSGESGASLARLMCSREPLEKLGTVFKGIKQAELSTRSDEEAASRMDTQGVPTDLRWLVFFNNEFCGASMRLSVTRYSTEALPPLGWGHHRFEQGDTHILNRDRLPNQQELCDWSDLIMGFENRLGFQSALDIFLSTSMRVGQNVFPGMHNLLRMTFEMRCMYRIWSQKKFFQQPGSERPMEEVPRRVCNELRDLAKDAMIRLERDILQMFDNYLLPPRTPCSTEERLILWACIMQTILLYQNVSGLIDGDCQSQPMAGLIRPDYKDICWLTTKIFNALVVRFDVYFAKNPNMRFDESGDTSTREAKKRLNEILEDIASRRQEFFSDIQSRPGPLDHRLIILLGGHTTRKQSKPRNPHQDLNPRSKRVKT